jgi:hypothetical protein
MPNMKPRVIIAAAVAILVAGSSLTAYRVMTPTVSRKATVFLEDYCRCCERWAQHMMDNGYEVELRPVVRSELDSLRRSLGIPEEKAACHTALIDGHVVEGHVPADVIDRVLRKRLSFAALAVPGMPHGSPGMEDEVKDFYEVFGKRQDGVWEVIATRGIAEKK